MLFFLQNTTSITGSPTGHRRVPVTAAFASTTKWTLWSAARPATSDWLLHSSLLFYRGSSRSGWTLTKSRTASARTVPSVYCMRPSRPSQAPPPASEDPPLTTKPRTAKTASWAAAGVRPKTTWWLCPAECRWCCWSARCCFDGELLTWLHFLTFQSWLRTVFI